MSIKRPVETTPENLKAIAEELQRCSADLAAFAELTRSANFPQIKVTNFGQLKNAVKFSNNFLSAAKQSLWQAKEERGDFGTASDGAATNGAKTARVRSSRKRSEK